MLQIAELVPQEQCALCIILKMFFKQAFMKKVANTNDIEYKCLLISYKLKQFFGYQDQVNFFKYFHVSLYHHQRKASKQK